MPEEFDTLEGNSENTDLDGVAECERYNLNCEDKIKMILAEKHPKELVEYQKNIEKYTALNSIVNSYKGTEANKNTEREKLIKKILWILAIQIGVFSLVFVLIFIFLGVKNEVENLILLSKWFLGATLSETIGIVYVMVKYLFNDGEKLMEHLKELVNGDEIKKNTNSNKQKKYFKKRAS